jgi:hypothetical protein
MTIKPLTKMARPQMTPDEYRFGVLSATNPALLIFGICAQISRHQLDWKCPFESENSFRGEIRSFLT